MAARSVACPVPSYRAFTGRPSAVGASFRLQSPVRLGLVPLETPACCGGAAAVELAEPSEPLGCGDLRQTARGPFANESGCVK